MELRIKSDKIGINPQPSVGSRIYFHSLMTTLTLAMSPHPKETDATNGTKVAIHVADAP